MTCFFVEGCGNAEMASIFALIGFTLGFFSTFVPLYLREKESYLETEFSLMTLSMSSTE